MNPIYISIFALLISFLGLAGFIFTSYYQMFRKANLSVYAGENLAATFDNKKRLNLDIGFTFHNNGAQTGTVIKIYGKILDHSKSRNSNVTWLSIVGNRNIIDLEGINQSAYRWVETLVIPGYQANTWRIRLRTEDEFQLHEGIYKLDLKLIMGNTEKISTIKSIKFKINSDEVLNEKYQYKNSYGKQFYFKREL